jgi:hypothetical protein
MAKQYTQSEIHYLIENYGKIPVEQIATHLGRSIHSVRMMAKVWRLSKPNKHTMAILQPMNTTLIYPYKKK